MGGGGGGEGSAEAWGDFAGSCELNLAQCAWNSLLFAKDIVKIGILGKGRILCPRIGTGSVSNVSVLKTCPTSIRAVDQILYHTRRKVVFRYSALKSVKAPNYFRFSVVYCLRIS